MFANGMHCEMCGAAIKGPAKTVRVEGAELSVCVQCARYGVEVQQPKRQDLVQKGGVVKPGTAPVRKRRDVFDYMEGEIAEDYSERVRKARMEMGLSQKELALEIMERELLIKKIEKGELLPEDDVRKKLEKALGISLLDAPPLEEAKPSHKSVVPTLGDVISIKRVPK